MGIRGFIMSILVSKIISTEFFSVDQIFENKGKVYTYLNPVSYLTALENKKLFSQMDGIFADGGLLVKAIKLVYGKQVTRRSFDMTSMAPELFTYAAEHGKSVYIVASKQEQVEKAVEIFRERYPKVRFAGYRNGYFASEEEMNQEARHITELNPDFLIVGMGALMQEKFLLKVKGAGYQGIGFTCGGFIHQTSKNEIDYYPAWVDKTNLRFVYRMWKEPHTRKRYLMAGLLFPARFIAERIFG
jgi:exopolysaccharide biosynthesis WecB/TagA/CpsF family protein